MADSAEADLSCVSLERDTAFLLPVPAGIFTLLAQQSIPFTPPYQLLFPSLYPLIEL